ncbi:MAG TPA: alkaline phosphatase family protein [Planctomycetaceae bacterium]|nr:alkaline phosphatase family protein [Planctomycetaceae bacterium]
MFRFAAFIALALQSVGWAVEPVKKVLFIGIDGTRWDAIEAANTPQLDKLAEQGTLSIGTEIIAPRETKGDTVSGPGWSNLLCGVWPDKHGTIDNSFKGMNYKDYPHFFARIKEANPKLQTASFTDWGPISKHILSGADEVIGEDAHGASAYAEADARLAKACATHIREKNPDAVMLYLGQVDETGHAKGFHPKVPEYIAAIERVDGLIAEVITAVRARSTYAQEDWLILIGTDHGGAGTGHGGGREMPEIRRTFMIVSGPSTVRGRLEEQTYQVDHVATALTHLGIALQPEWKLDGRAVGLKAK